VSVVDEVALAERLSFVRQRIAQALTSRGREADDATLIVVTKFHPADLVRALVDCGVHDVGENKHQEAAAKHAECAELNVNWHFIGQLQSNKAAAVRRYAQAVHSVDRPSLVSALERAGENEPDTGALECFLQINLTDDPSRGGVAWADIPDMAELMVNARTLTFAGVMAVAPLDVDPREAFERVARASELVRSIAPEAQAISAGMSHDFEAAIEFGATHLRIGSQITGKRPAPG
jgi:pyridoxal phosphate enzyme (YggS family)